MCTSTKEKRWEWRVLEKGASEKCTFPFNHVYCLNKNLILVCLLFLGLFGEYFDLYFQFYSFDSFTSRGCIEGQLLNFYGIQVFTYGRYDF